jgi:tetratricopeptide (TPR) repeat protein
MTKLFISYAHLDSGVVLNISRQLEEAGYEVWIDKLGIQGGDLWVSEIVKGIRGCDIFLLFVSSNSVRSEYVRRELDVAFGEKRKIVHVMIENVDLPDGWVYQLAGLQYIDYRSPDWKSQLLEALGSELAPPQQPVRDTGKLKNPYSSLPVLELIERALIFSNREKELHEGIEQLKDHRLLLVTGMPGIGKSTFARALLDSIPADSPEPFWYNFERHRNSGNTLGVLLDRISGHLEVCLRMEVRREVMAFRDSPGGNASVNDVDVLIGFLNQEKPIWLVFDNLETVLSRDTNGFLDEGLELLFDSLKNNTHNAKIILTNPFVPVLKNGEPFLEAGTQALTLEGLDDASAIAFLRAYGVPDISESQLAPWIREINGHPFVLNYIARYIQTIGIPAAMENLQGGLEEINQRFGDSLKQRLSSQEFTALQSLTILNREISLTGLCQIAQVRPGIIVRLREMGLLQTNDAGKFWLHNIVRVSLKPAESAVTRELHLRALKFYRTQTIPSLRQSIDDYAGVLEWHHHAVESGDVVNAYSALYSTGLEDQLIKWNEYDLLAQLCEQTLAVAEVEQNRPSKVERIKIHRTLGTVYFYMGDFTNSITYLKTALDLLQPEEEKELQIALLIELSESYNGNRDFELATEICNRAIRSLSTLHNDDLQAKVLHLRGIINRDQGDSEQAIRDLEEALRLYRKLMDHLHIVNATVDLGIVYYRRNQFTEAVATYRQVIVLCEAIQDMRGVMIAHFNIGNIRLQDGQYEEALKDLQVALEIARKRKFSWMEVWAGLDLAEAQVELLDLNSGERELSILSPVIKKQASDCFSGQELSIIARLHWRRKQAGLAHDYFKRAFRLFESADCQEQKGRAYIAYAVFMNEQGNTEQAKEALLQGRSIFKMLNNELGLKAVQRAALDMQADNRTL